MSALGHLNMLRDRVRCEAYRTALRAMVRPGDVIADVGTDTGLLAYFALEAGAAKVYAIEQDATTLEGAQLLAQANRPASRIIFMHGRSTKLTLPEPVDGIVSERFGAMAIEEDCPRSIADARTRFLKPGGWVIPWTATLYIAPVEAPVLYAAPADPPTHWRQSFFPLDEPVTVQHGDTLTVQLSVRPWLQRLVWHWEVTVQRAGRSVMHERIPPRARRRCPPQTSSAPAATPRSLDIPRDTDYRGINHPGRTAMEPLTICYTKNPNFIPRRIAGEHILVPLKRTPGEPDALFVLNATGGFIWEQLSEATPVAAVRDRLVAQFDVTPEQAERDLADVLQQLAAIGAIATAT